MAGDTLETLQPAILLKSITVQTRFEGSATLVADVTAVDSASAALDHLSRQLPDVLVSDIGMPGEDGRAFLRRLRARDAGHGGRVPAIALTAYATKADAIKARAAGFDRHVSKPVAPAEILDAVAAWCLAADKFRTAHGALHTRCGTPGGPLLAVSSARTAIREAWRLLMSVSEHARRSRSPFHHRPSRSR